MAKGYSSDFVNEVNSADDKKLGVRLGLVCIRRNIPVVDVAEFFDVSRTSVYAWFRGGNVDTKHTDKMQKLVDKLS